MTPQNPEPAEYGFRESIRASAIGERKYVRYFDGRGHFAHLRLRLIPNGDACVSVSPSEKLDLPEAYYEAAEQALLEVIRCGPVYGFPCHGFRIEIAGGSYLPRHSYPQAFAIVARMAFDDGMLRAGRIVVEPWMEITLRAQGRWLGRMSQRVQEIMGETTMELRTEASTMQLTLSIPRRLIPVLIDSFPAEDVQLRLTRQFVARYRPVPERLNVSPRHLGNYDDWS
jgi:translation elongation factor EF-G